ncbi:glycosyltransferase [Sulfuritalea sp.]|uniref:MraY family glycosyltransferase n=1 Tax=Sulfuritalea sp. TaxID=2480090 RepID=UPI001ACC5D72|nr:glycosyltransferase [Sulfuritalea sp.]MBN8474955.1 glycosyltransferase family 4 protein [Sulfuritalea sp.]
MAFILAALAAALVVTLFVMRRSFADSRLQQGIPPGTRLTAWTREANLKGWGRAGGLGVAAGLLLSLALRLFDDSAIAGTSLWLLLAATPVFVAGLADDFTQRVRPSLRLVAAFVSALLAGLFLDTWVNRIDVPALDVAFAIPAVAIAFSCLMVAGLVNAFNIIDGFNGLAGGVASLILVGIAYVAFKVGDLVVLTASLTAIGAIAGFMLFNFPRGLIYLGDGGAYLLGFWIGELLIMLVARNPQVSAWFPALLCSYPVCEMLFSIYRRAFVRRSHPGAPDIAHLHHLIYKRLVRWLAGPSGMQVRHEHGNALTSPYLWILTSIGVGPAVVFWQKTLVLQIGCIVFAAAYVYAYVRIVRFRSPRWWSLRRTPPGPTEKP